MNEKAIENVSNQIINTCGHIASLALGIKETKEYSHKIADTYESLLLDEVTHTQILTLELTRLVTGEANADEGGSVFAEGDLNSVEGGKNPEKRRDA